MMQRIFGPIGLTDRRLKRSGLRYLPRKIRYFLSLKQWLEYQLLYPSADNLNRGQ
ncbi:hypothetical protein [Tatumella terrea]|uniref:Transposase n=1 Tax=Tatumella terrea TaxID=419007 RepID=A0ABW1VVM2_9GAMM